MPAPLVECIILSDAVKLAEFFFRRVLNGLVVMVVPKHQVTMGFTLLGTFSYQRSELESAMQYLRRILLYTIA